MSKKGGSQNTTTEVKMHPEIEKAALANLGLANEVAALGAIPYRGATVAGFSPQQISGMNGYNQAANAFGMGGVPTQGMSGNSLYSALTGMPPPTQQVGGFSGYSGMGMADDAFARLPPAQRALIQSFTMDPVTGAQPVNPAVPRINDVVVNPQSGRTPQERMAIQRHNASKAAEQRAADIAAAALVPYDRAARRSKLKWQNRKGRD